MPSSARERDRIRTVRGRGHRELGVLYRRGGDQGSVNSVKSFIHRKASSRKCKKKISWSLPLLLLPQTVLPQGLKRLRWALLL